MNLFNIGEMNESNDAEASSSGQVGEDPNAWLAEMLEGDREMAESFMDIQKTFGQQPEEIRKNISKFEESWKARREIKMEALEAFGITLEPDEDDFLQDYEMATMGTGNDATQEQAAHKNNKDWIAMLATTPELLLLVAKFLMPKDLISLYAISRDFHDFFDHHLTSGIIQCARYHAPNSARIFSYKLHEKLCTNDPKGYYDPISRELVIKKVPSLRWLQMVTYRERIVRDIIALMARTGHRMPPTMELTLKKTWLILDIATSARRLQMMHDRYFWTDMDLYNLQLFIVKLDMRLNDPYEGTGDDSLRKVLLGQRSLTKLRNFLNRNENKTSIDLIKLTIRYKYTVPQYDLRSLPIWEIPPWEIGVGHLEGWGAGLRHLKRPDELVIQESVRRGLGFKTHLMSMMMSGYVDPITGINLAFTDEELYMSDEDDKLRSRQKAEALKRAKVSGKGKGKEKEMDVEMTM